MSLVFIPA